jgi:TonB-dependent receptor
MHNCDDVLKRLLMTTTAMAFAFAAPQAFAQDSSDTDVEDADEIVVTGIRAALATAADLKRNADTAVDSITASDVSTLPDLSVAEALARVPGVVVQRIALDANGGDFPSPEGGGNLIRGLTLVRSELNGRDAFSASQGRALDFGTIPPELIGAVDVYKNTSADLIEGGIGGSINLRTLEPFDRPGQFAVATLDMTYTDLRDEISPDASIIIGNRWDTASGEFGLLGSVSYSELNSALNGFQIGQVVPFNVGDDTIALPGGFQLRTNDVDRERSSVYVASQYRNNEGNFEVTAKYARIDNTVDSDERTLEFFPDGESFNQFEVDGLTTSPFTSSGIPRCQGGNPPGGDPLNCEITDPVSGLYENGVISNNLRDWTGAAGAPFTNLGINQVDNSVTDDISLNIKFRPTDNLFVNLDGHYSTAEFTRERLWVGSRFFSDFRLNADLDNPMVELISNPAISAPFTRGDAGPVTSGDFSDPRNAFALFAADEFQDNEGDLYAISGDVEYEFDNDGWFDGIKVGARYSEREQTNRQAGLNWASIAPPWAGGYYPYSASTINSESVDFSDFFRGGVVSGANTNVLFPDRNLIRNYDAFVTAVSRDPNIPQRFDDNLNSTVYSDWAPLRGADGTVDYALRGAQGVIEEQVFNAYARFDFGNEFANGMSLDGNIGLRYTRSETDGAGINRFIPISNNNDAGENPIDFIPETVAFFETPQSTLEGPFVTDDRWLPSLNLKLNLNDEMLIRLGASKNITRPNLGQMTPNQTNVPLLQFVSNNDPADPMITDIRLTGINVFGGNPALKPILSDNLDLSYEWYFGDDSSFTVSGFYKDISNNIIYESQGLQNITLDGTTVPVTFNGDLNQDEAEIRGVEVAYQQFYDFLPGLLGNLGLQANYTYVDAETNAPLPIVDADGDGNPDSFERIFRYGVTDFLGLSEHSANIIGIYQSDEVELRLAYNWRSEYLSSYRDFVTGNPIFQTDRGYLDGSFKWDINDTLQFRVQAANILDTQANSEQQIDADGQRFDRTGFLGDRRIKVGFRAQF